MVSSEPCYKRKSKQLTQDWANAAGFRQGTGQSTVPGSASSALLTMQPALLASAQYHMRYTIVKVTALKSTPQCGVQGTKSLAGVQGVSPCSFSHGRAGGDEEQLCVDVSN
jgi:hypothetical protein